MQTVVMEHHDTSFLEHLREVVRRAGYDVITGPGPWSRVDLMIYDPRMTALDAHGMAYNLAVEAALAHPRVPILLAWPPTDVPDTGTLREIRAQVPRAHVAAADSAKLVQQIADVLTPEAPGHEVTA